MAPIAEKNSMDKEEEKTTATEEEEKSTPSSSISSKKLILAQVRRTPSERSTIPHHRETETFTSRNKNKKRPRRVFFPFVCSFDR